MTTTSFARIAALLAVLLWASKAASTALAGGPGKTPLEEVFFFLGLASALTAGGALALAYVPGRSLLIRVGSVIAGLVVLLAVAGLGVVLVEAVRTTDHWLWGEVNLWISALVATGLAWRTTPSRGHGQPVEVRAQPQTSSSS